MRRYDPMAMYPTMIIKAKQHKADCSDAHVIRVKERLAMLNDVDALAARVKRLERQNQHLRLAVLGAVLAGMVILGHRRAVMVSCSEHEAPASG